MKIIEKITEKNMKEIISTLDNDGLIIIPTDTVYGIACNCYSEKALRKIYEIKNRPKNKPICVLTNSVEKIESIAKKLSSKEKELMKKYFPGDLTIIVEKNNNISNLLTANLPTVGVRIPNHKVTLKILEAYPYPLATTSVNQTGTTPGIQVEDFLEEFQDKVDIIINDGKSPIGVSSTIVQVKDNKIKIIREGNLKVE